MSVVLHFYLGSSGGKCRCISRVGLGNRLLDPRTWPDAGNNYFNFFFILHCFLILFQQKKIYILCSKSVLIFANIAHVACFSLELISHFFSSLPRAIHVS
jgi:hypothetical protein